MNNLTKISSIAPGVYLVKGKNATVPGVSTFGDYSVWSAGALSSKAESKEWSLFFDGLLFRDYLSPKTDAECLLSTFEQRKEFNDILELDGFFNAILIHKSGERGYIFCDKLSARPQYLYKKQESLACAPTPTSFVDFDLDMNFNRTHLFEFLRFRYNSYNRTLIDEVERMLPGHYYEFDKNGIKECIKFLNFDQQLNHEITLEKAADWVYEICKKPMNAIFAHPKLKELDVHLPLTGGLDSRHLLGQVLELNKTPSLLRHINISEKDLYPVRIMSESLDIPLNSPSIFELNYQDLIQRWLERSGGLVNIHQFYLLQVKDGLPDNGALGFNGQLMDKFLGLAPVTSFKPGDSIIDRIWNKTFTGKTILNGLFHDSKTLRNRLFQIRKEEINSIKGEDWYRIAIDEFHQKSLQYTGVTDTMVNDGCMSFSPGSSSESLDFIRSVPYEIAGRKKARLEALKKYFPEIGAFPDDDGIPLIQKLDRPRTSPSPFKKNVTPLLKWLLSGFSGDPAPSTEHEWLRKIGTLKSFHKKMIYDGCIFQDSILARNPAFASWTIHQLGGYQAWALMSLLSAEIAYQHLCKKRSINEIMDWLKG